MLGALTQRHRMDRQHTCVDGDHHDLEEVARAIGADHEIARRVLTKLDPRDGRLWA